MYSLYYILNHVEFLTEKKLIIKSPLTVINKAKIGIHAPYFISKFKNFAVNFMSSNYGYFNENILAGIKRFK